MKTFALIAFVLSTTQAFASEVFCTGLTTAGHPVEAILSDGMLDLKIEHKNGIRNFLKETYTGKVTTFDVGTSSYTYTIVELSDKNGQAQGVLMTRSAACSAKNDMLCEENSELAMSWNASFPYRMKCLTRK